MPFSIYNTQNGLVQNPIAHQETRCLDKECNRHIIRDWIIGEANGAAAQRYTYDGFGAPTVRDAAGAPTGAAPLTNYLYTGREWQPESGLYNYRNRFYHPQIGRFLQPDPIGFDGGDWNIYAYVGNEPGARVDPDGLLDVHVWHYRGKGVAWGHASITLEDGTHISWWPSGNRKKCFGSIYSAEPNENQTFEDDVDLEEQPPDETIHIDGLDEKAIKDWWEDYKRTHKWKTLSNNCSTIAYKALRKGGAPLSIKFIWLPNAIDDYARKIQAKIGQ